jgi:hypothetical protein
MLHQMRHVLSSDVDEATGMLIFQSGYCANALKKTTSKLSLKRSKSILSCLVLSCLVLRSIMQHTGNVHFFLQFI